MDKNIENISNNVVKALIEEAENIKSTISNFKTVGDIQKEIEADSEILRYFTRVFLKEDGEELYLDDIKGLDSSLPLYCIEFECLTDWEDVQGREEKLGEYKDFAIDYPMYFPATDDMDFDVFDFEEDCPVSSTNSLADVKEDSSSILSDVIEYIEELEYEKEDR